MHSYLSIKTKHGNPVSQTIDAPIMIFDFWELGDGIAALMIVLIFGVVFYSWGAMTVLLIFCLGVGPVIKRKNNRGIFLHSPYRHFKVSLPGLINPKGKRKYSD